MIKKKYEHFHYSSYLIYNAKWKAPQFMKLENINTHNENRHIMLLTKRLERNRNHLNVKFTTNSKTRDLVNI